MNTPTPHCIWIKDNIECHGLVFKEIEKNLIELTLEKDFKHVMFVLKTPNRIVCTGSDFQVFVWGLTSYYLWRLSSKTAACLLLGKSVFNKLDDKTYYVAETHVSFVKEVMFKIRFFADILRNIVGGKNIVFLVDEKIAQGVSRETIFSVGSNPLSDLQLYIISILTDKLGDESKAKKVIELVEKNIISTNILSNMNLLKKYLDLINL